MIKRSILTEVAFAAVKTKDSHFQEVFRRLVPRLGIKKAIWAIAHRICRLIWKLLTRALSTSNKEREARIRKPSASEPANLSEICAASAIKC